MNKVLQIAAAIVCPITWAEEVAAVQAATGMLPDADTAAATTVTTADETTTTAPASPEQVQLTPDQQNYVQISRDIMAVLQNLTQTLGSVTNKETADLAAPKVTEIAAQLHQLQEAADAVPAPTEELEQALKLSMSEEEVKSAVHNFLVTVIQVAQVNCYDSEAMLAALTQVLGTETGL